MRAEACTSAVGGIPWPRPLWSTGCAHHLAGGKCAEVGRPIVRVRKCRELVQTPTCQVVGQNLNIEAPLPGPRGAPSESPGIVLALQPESPTETSLLP